MANNFSTSGVSHTMDVAGFSSAQGTPFLWHSAASSRAEDIVALPVARAL